jgi:adenine-specific DNA-methyltransferase
VKVSSAVENINVMRYMGNKRRLLPHITGIITDRCRPGDTVVDLMAGTHAVGFALGERNAIVANDIGSYSLPIGRALFTRPTGFEPDRWLELLSSAAAENHSEGVFTFFRDNYADTYFSLRQCMEIDDLRYAIEVLDVYDHYAADLAMAALISSMCYAQSTPGHFAQFMPADHARIGPLRAISIFEAFSERFRHWPIAAAAYEHEVLAEDWRVVFAAGFAADAKVVYIDPPYNTEQYSRFYHVLETLVRYDNPELRHKARYRTGRFKSGFCYKRTVESEFSELFRRCGSACGADIVMSYCSTGLVSRELFARLCRPMYRLDDVQEVDFAHSTQGKGTKNGIRELIFTFVHTG